MKAIIIIVALIASISYYNDSEALTPWVNAAGDAAIITTKIVKTTGNELHKIARQNDSVSDKLSNKIEDTKYSLNN